AAVADRSLRLRYQTFRGDTETLDADVSGIHWSFFFSPIRCYGLLFLFFGFSDKCWVVTLNLFTLQEVYRLLELVVVGAAKFEHFGFDKLFVFLRRSLLGFVAVKQMALQIDLSRQTEQIALRGIVDHDVGFDACNLNGSARRRVIQGGG